MSTFKWKEVLTVSVTEMSRADALRAAQTINALLDMNATSDGFISNELHWMNVSNAPAKVIYQDAVLDNGNHEIVVDDLAFTLTLPLTRENFDALPFSLTSLWIEVAEKENEVLSNHFLSLINRILPLSNGHKSDAVAS